MDDVLEKLEGTIISQESNNENNTSNFEGLYKNWGKLGNQEERRKEILEVQKSNRNSKLDRFRGILELVSAVEERDIFRSNTKAYYRPNIYVAGFHRTSLSYSNVLMLSEWMIEKPEDFNDNWYVVPCPKGVRMLVVANQNRTKCYTKYGHFKFEKRSALPGGNPCDGRRNNCCVLDCFYQEKINTMFILDLLAWNNQPFTDGETEFRHYWLQTQLAELPDLQVINKKNQIIFKLLPKTPCTPQSFNEFMMSYPPFEQNFPPMDGLLFYHKRAHYVAGETPLVGWLFPYMVPEVLGNDITMNEAYLMEKPATYVNQADFIQSFEVKHAKRKSRSRLSSTNSMDTGEVPKPEAQPKKTGSKKGNRKTTKATETMEAEESEQSGSKENNREDSKEESQANDIMEAENSISQNEENNKEDNKEESQANDTMEAENSVSQNEEDSKEDNKKESQGNDTMEAESLVPHNDNMVADAINKGLQVVAQE